MDVSLREQSATPDISVIIPVYNRVRLLKNSLGCLQKQTFPGRAEIILVDDASAEDVPAVINSCWPKDKEPPIYIRHSHNQGAAGARNTGLDAARGEYVAFVDHDDEIHPDYLSKLYQTAKEKNADYVACGVLQRAADGKQRIYADRSVDIVGGKNVMTVMTDFQLNIATWGSIVKRELIESHHIRFTKGEFEDILFFFQVGCYCRHYIAISDKIYIQCLEPNSLTQTTKDNKNFSYFQGLPKILPKVKDMIAKLGAELPFVTANERRIYLFFLRLSLLTLRNERDKLPPDEYVARLETSLREHFDDDNVYIYIRTFLDLNEFLRGERDNLRQNMAKLLNSIVGDVNAMGRELNKPLI